MSIIGGGKVLVKSSWSSSILFDPVTNPFPLRVPVDKLVSVLVLKPLLNLVNELDDVVVKVAKS